MLPPEAAVDEGPYGDLLWQVQKCTDCGDGYNDNGPKRKSNNRYGTNLNSGTTNDIVRLLKGANDTCNEHILRRYRVDCLRIYYGWVADSLPDSGDYLPIKKAMRKAEQKLAAIVSANVDRTEPVITPRDGHKKNAKKLPPLRAIKKSAESKAVAQAEKSGQGDGVGHPAVRRRSDPAHRALSGGGRSGGFQPGDPALRLICRAIGPLRVLSGRHFIKEIFR